MPTASRQLAAEVLETCLDEHERNLLRTASHSIEKAVGLYGRQHGGHEGVEREVRRIKEKVEDALGTRIERAQRAESRSVEEAARDVSGGDWRPLALTSAALAGSVNGAGAAGPQSGPPTAAPASPSPVSFDRPPLFPAEGGAVQGAVLRALARQRMSPKRLAFETGELSGANALRTFQRMKTRLIRMEAHGLVERTEENAYDWPGAVPGRGRPGRVWRLVDEEPGVPAALNQASPTRVPPRGVSRDELDAAPIVAAAPVAAAAPAPLCPHSVPAHLCRVCSPPSNGTPADAQAAELDRLHERGWTGGGEPFDAQELWKGLSLDQRMELMLVVLGSATFAETVRALDRSAVG